MTSVHASYTVPDSVRLRLKSATAAAHADIDARYAPLMARGEPGYRDFLRATAGALLPLEAALSAASVTRILPDWQQRSRSAALRADMAELGIAGWQPAAAPRVDGEAYQFGVLYVLEGSRLGATVLLRTIHNSEAADGRRATRYLRHGEGLPLWRTFLERLENSHAVKRAPEHAIAGARAAFKLFGATAPLPRRGIGDAE
jgi:heme oxygenase